MFLDNVFTACSLLHLTLLSLERLYATLFPIRHCLMLNWVYFKAIVCIWFLAVIPESAGAALYLIAPQASQYVWALLTIAVLFTVIVSYVIIALNLKRRVLHTHLVQRHPKGNLQSRCWLSLFLAHLLFFPFLDAVLGISMKLQGLSAQARFDIQQSLSVFFYTNSFVNH